MKRHKALISKIIIQSLHVFYTLKMQKRKSGKIKKISFDRK